MFQKITGQNHNMVPVGQILTDNFVGLEWGDELKSLNHELSNFSLRRANTNRNCSPPFLTDPNESISHSDEALGLEFASSLPFVSTPTPAHMPTLLAKTSESGFQDNSSDSYNHSGGFDNSGFRFHGVGNNERTFSSSSNSSNTSFISEGSFNSILRNAQGDGYRDSSGLLTASTPYRNGESGFNGNEGISSRNTSGRVEDSFGYSGNSFQDQMPAEVEREPHRRWNFLEQPAPPTTPSRLNRGNDQGGRFLDSPHNSKPPGMNHTMNNDFSSVLDSLNQLECSPKTATTLFGNSIWGSPSNGGNNQNQSPQWSTGMLPPGLSAKQTVQCLQILQDIFDECKEVGDSARATQTCALMQMLQQHLLSELVSPTSPTNSSSGPITPTDSTADRAVDRAAKHHREVAGNADATFTWSGQLPPRIHRNPTYSCKVFLGGVPWDITEGALISAFKPFGNVKIEWPGKEGVPSQPKGYAYVIFEHEKQIKLLLQNCTHDYSSSRAGNWYYKISSKRMRGKDVQVIPWALSDSNYVKCQATKLDGKKTIFIGALHGMLNAEGLATIMNDLFDGVIYAGIDTDRHKYPIGSGRLTFNNNKSYMKAVSAAFVEIKTSKFTKKVQVDPYLEDATCSICNLQQAPYFCREWCCFRYFCRTCYQVQHSGESFRSHRPLMRNASKPQGTIGSVVAANFSPEGNHGVGHNSSNISTNASCSSFPGFQRRHESAHNTRFSQMR